MPPSEARMTANPIGSPDPGHLDADRALAAADTLEADGLLVEAVDLLTVSNQGRRDARVARRLVQLRHDAFLATVDRSSPPPWPPDVAAVPTFSEPPDLERDRLTLPVLLGGVLQQGCVLVRGLLPAERVALLIDDVDRAFDAFDRHAAGATRAEVAPWFEPFKPRPPYSVGVRRKWNRDGGGVLAADSPPALFDLLDTIEEAGLRELITAYLGERPALSMNKTTLRRIGQYAHVDWHQDGAFLGKGIRTLNVWIALDRCGRDAPGLDIVPRRLDGVLDIGTEGAYFDWSTAPDTVDRALDGRSIWRPEFEAGDALLFDHFLLHRTASEPEMTHERHATETWFFAPSVYPPDTQIPLLF